MIDDAARARLAAFHAEVDRLATSLGEIHRERIQCAAGCYDCCIDGITVFEIEADCIRSNASQLLVEGAPHPPGRCAFLSVSGACRIHGSRPYVCRTQGLPLRWISEADDGSLTELRDICPLNEIDRPIEELARRDCWELGPFEGVLEALQRSTDGGAGRRVSLRSLFLNQERPEKRSQRKLAATAWQPR